MVHLSDKKFIPWSKHTNYASIVGERRPSEVGQGALVTIKNVDKDLDDQRNHLSKMHRKSLYRLDAQRKELEKSMLQYTDKVREIRDTQTNDLFREIHTRQSQRRLSDARSLTNSLDSQETISLPVDSANIRKRKKRLQISRKCMFPPILESLSKHENRQRLIRPLSADRHCSESKYRYLSKLELRGNDTSRSEQIETHSNRTRNSSTQLSLSIQRRDPAITIEEDCSNPVFESETTNIVESGYSSAVELKEDPGKEEEENYILTTNNTIQRKELLTLPKIHKRKAVGT